VLALDHENPEAHLELGILHEHGGKPEKAEEHFVESLKADPENPRALYAYASLYYTADNLEAAEEILERAIATDARTPLPSRRSPASGPATASTATPWTLSRGPLRPARATSSTSGAPWSSPPCTPTRASHPPLAHGAPQEQRTGLGPRVSTNLTLGILLVVVGIAGLSFGVYALMRGGRDQEGGVGPLPERGVHVVAGFRMLVVGTLGLAGGMYLLWAAP
jgi:tetratricopeptide (TPR) repeat protein